MDIVSIASLLLPTLLSAVFGRGKEILGLPMPSPWLKMIRLSAEIYKKLTPVQKTKLVDMGVLPPDFERELLAVFDTYLGTETPSKPLFQRILQKQPKKKVEEDSPYKQFHKTLKMVNPYEVKKLYHNQYIGFMNLYKDIADKYYPDIKISVTRGKFPNYPELFDKWKKLHKILVSPKK
jgi:hypothetical protein